MSPEKRNRTREELELAIIESLRDNGAMSMRELAEDLGYSRHAQNLYATVRSLVQQGKAEYTLPNKKTSRNQRVRLRL